MAKLIPIKDIVIDDSFYPRTGGPDWRVIETYKQAMKMGDKFPPVVLAPVDGKITLIDGMHRLEAAKKLKKTRISSELLKAMSETQAYEEALRRNMINGKQLSFYDKLSAYKRLKDAGYTMKKISGILSIPQAKMRKFVSDRMTVSTTGEEVVLKGTLKHLSERGKKIVSVADQELLSGSSQNFLITQLITLIVNHWLDEKDKTMMDNLAELRLLLMELPIGEEA